jgi:hypothetical protein
MKIWELFCLFLFWMYFLNISLHKNIILNNRVGDLGNICVVIGRSKSEDSRLYLIGGNVSDVPGPNLLCVLPCMKATKSCVFFVMWLFFYFPENHGQLAHEWANRTPDSEPRWWWTGVIENDIKLLSMSCRKYMLMQIYCTLYI